MCFREDGRDRERERARAQREREREREREKKTERRRREREDERERGRALPHEAAEDSRRARARTARELQRVRRELLRVRRELLRIRKELLRIRRELLRVRESITFQVAYPRANTRPLVTERGLQTPESQSLLSHVPACYTRARSRAARSMCARARAR